MKDRRVAAQLNEAAAVLADEARDGYLVARLNAHARSIEALSGRLDLEGSINERQDQALTEVEARIEDLNRLYARLSRLEARIEEIARCLAACNVRLLP